TTLPLALGRLHVAGEVRRLSTTGRLDNQRFRYALWRPNPIAKVKLDEAAAASQLVQRFFRWMGPATVQEFAWWAGLGVKAAAVACAAAGLVPDGEGRLLLPEHKAALAAAKPSKAIALVPFRDNYPGLRRDLSALFDPA